MSIAMSISSLEEVAGLWHDMAMWPKNGPPPFTIIKIVALTHFDSFGIYNFSIVVIEL